MIAAITKAGLGQACNTRANSGQNTDKSTEGGRWCCYYKAQPVLQLVLDHIAPYSEYQMTQAGTQILS